MDNINVKENIGLKGTITVRSHRAGTVEKIQELLAAGRKAEAEELFAAGEIKSKTENMIMVGNNTGKDLLVQFLLSVYNGGFAFTPGISWGAIGTGIAPAAAPTVGTGSSGVLTGAYQYLVTFTTAAGETTAGPASAIVNPSSQQVALTNIPLGYTGSGVTGRNIYRTLAGGTVYYLLHSIADNTTTTYTDNTADGSLGSQQPPATSTAGSIAVTAQDTQLQTETNRTSPAYALDVSYAQATLQFLFQDSVLANMTYYEFCSVMAGSSSPNTGQIFNHALLGTAYTKVTGQDTTVQLDIALS